MVRNNDDHDDNDGGGGGGGGGGVKNQAPQWCQTLGELFEAYPDARVINMHRGPESVLVSISSLAVKIAGVNSDTVDAKALAKVQHDYWERSLQKM